MKKILLYIGMAAIVASCTKSEIVEATGESDAIQFTTSSEITRAAAKTDWEVGDLIGVYDGVTASNVGYEATYKDIDGTNFTALSSEVYFRNNPISTSFYAYYPYDEDVADNIVPIDLEAAQVDLLRSEAWASGDNSKVQFEFEHMLSRISVTLTLGDETLDSSSIRVFLGGCYTSGSLDVTGGSLSVDETTTGHIETSVDGLVATAIVMPNTYTSPITIYFEVGNRAFYKTFTPTWSQGNQYDYTATLGEESVVFSLDDIVSWNEAVLGDVLNSCSEYDIVIVTSGSENEISYDSCKIYTSKGLAVFRDLVNSLDSGVVAKVSGVTSLDYTLNCLALDAELMNDIDLGGDEWSPITEYAGEFEGNNFEVKGLYIKEGATQIGLFGKIQRAMIQNLGVSGSVTGGSSVGGLVGYSFKSTINSCYSNVTVTGTSNDIGGLVGHSEESTGIYNSYNLGSVTGSSNVGGLAGKLEDTGDENTLCYNSYNLGSVTGSSYVGGLAGKCIGAKLNNCYSSAIVIGSSYVGGVVGSIEACEMTGSEVTNCYYNSTYYGGEGCGAIGEYSTAATHPRTTEYLKSSEFLNAINAGASSLSSSTVSICSWKSGEDDYPTIDFGSSADSGAIAYDITYDSDSDIYYIYTYKGLVAFSDLVNGSGNTQADAGGLSLKDVTFENNGYKTELNAMLMADVDLSTVSKWTPICLYDDFSLSSYAGVFDGNGYVVSNLTYDDTSDTSSHHIALFGLVGTSATIKNLGVTGEIKALSYAAGIAASNYGVIKNCYSKVNIEAGGGSGGGIAASNNGDIQECYNAGTVSGSSVVGGVVGNLGTGGSISSCYNTAKVTTTANSGQKIGGVVGYSKSGSIVINCYNTAEVTYEYGCTETINVGGVAGCCEGTLVNCYNLGDVSGYSNVGGIVGYYSANDTLTACYNGGNVTANTGAALKYAGGVAGNFDVDYSSVSCCYYLSSTSNAGLYYSDESFVTAITDKLYITDSSGVTSTVGSLTAAAATYNATSPAVKACQWMSDSNSTHPILYLGSVARSVD